MKIQSPATKKARIEIIPMIDAIFFLLVFFMMTSLQMVKMKGVGVALPTNSPGGAVAKTQAALSPSPAQAAAMSKLIVSVTDKGDYFLNTQKSSPQALSADLQKGVNARPGAVVIVNVAKSQTTQNLITVMDAVNRVTPRGNAPLQVMIATETVDADGMASRPAARPSRPAR